MKKLLIIGRPQRWENNHTTPHTLPYLIAQDGLSVDILDYEDPKNLGFIDNLEMPNYTFRLYDNFELSSLLTQPSHKSYLNQYDYLWLRLDPFNTTRFFKRLAQKTDELVILNDPLGTIELSNKTFLISLRDILGDLMPKIQLCETLADIEDFAKTCPNMVLKNPLGAGGDGVKRFCKNYETDFSNLADIQNFLETAGSLLAMEYMDSTSQVDNRLIVVSGEIYSVLCRKPPEGGWLCNLNAGGNYCKGEINNDEREIVKRLAPVLKKKGIFLSGIDTLIDSHGNRKLSEINVSNVGGFVECGIIDNVNHCKRLADDLVKEMQRLENSR